MKKLKVLWVAALGAVLLFSQCVGYNSDVLYGRNVVRGNGKIKKESQQISSYERIILEAGYDVVLTDRAQGEVIIEGEESIISLVKMKVSGKKLELKFDSKKGVVQYKKLVVYVPAQGVRYLHLRSSGSIRNKGNLKTKTLNINSEGSGDVVLNHLNTEKIEVQLRGSGDINLSGSTEVFIANLQGSGDISAYKFNADEVNTEIRGSGDIEVYAGKSFVGEVQGSGDIKVKGKPVNVSKNRKGSGNIQIFYK